MKATVYNHAAAIARCLAKVDNAVKQQRHNAGFASTVFAFALVATSLLPSAPLQATPLVVNAVFEDSGSTYAHPVSGHYTGVGAAPDAGTFWNGVPNGINIGTGGGGFHAAVTSGALNNSTGGATSVTFSLTNYFAQDIEGTYNQTTSLAPQLFGHIVYGGHDAEAAATFSIGHLQAGAHYDLYLYSMAGYPNSNDTTFTIDGVAGSTHVVGLPTDSGYNSFKDATATTLGNYVEYSDLIATGGTISGTFYGGNGRFNGFQIVEVVPEPASVVLLGLSAAGMLAAIWRRRRS